MIFKLPSPILKRVWITNKKDAPSWAGIFCQSSKKSPHSKTTERGIKAIDTLLECGLMEQSTFLPHNSALWKIPPIDITRSEPLQIALHEYVGINVKEYEQIYEDWHYPSDLTIMTPSLIDHLTGAPDKYARYYHNYAPDKYLNFRSCIEKLERDNVIERNELNGKVQWQFINHQNPVEPEPSENFSYIMNQVETRQFEEISSTIHGSKRKLTTLVKRNEVIISPSSSFTMTPAKRVQGEHELTPVSLIELLKEKNHRNQS